MCYETLWYFTSFLSFFNWLLTLTNTYAWIAHLIKEVSTFYKFRAKRMLSPVHLKICGESLEKRNIKKTAQTGSGRNKNLHTYWPTGFIPCNNANYYHKTCSASWQDEANPGSWLATRAEKKKKKESSLSHIINVWWRCLNNSFVVVCG